MRTILAALLLLSAPAFAARYTVMEHWNTPMVPNAYGEPTDSLGVGMDGNYCVGYSGATENLSTGAYALTDPGGHTSFTARVPPNTARTGCGWAASEWSTRQGWPGNGTTPYGPSPYGYGYYEVRMRPTCTQGVSTSFFWVQAPNYGPLERDEDVIGQADHQFIALNAHFQHGLSYLLIKEALGVAKRAWHFIHSAHWPWIIPCGDEATQCAL